MTEQDRINKLIHDSQWTLTPLAMSCALTMRHPSLSDNRADDRRLKDAIKESSGIHDLFIPLDMKKKLSQKLREYDFTVEVIVVYTGAVWELADIRDAAVPAQLYGISVDLGSSTLAFYLVDMRKGEVVDLHSIENPQIPYGEDILTRIYMAHNEEGRNLLQSLILEGFSEAVYELEKRNKLVRDDIFAMTVAGNTTMIHFFLNLPVDTLCREPYIPVVNIPGIVRNGELSLPLHEKGVCYVLPNVGSYFGGDVIAGIVMSQIFQYDHYSFIIDVGTNAEVVLGNKDILIVSAGSAGPGLEGDILEFGMRATGGAIDSVVIDPETLSLTYHTLGSEKARGLCGSGAIDLLAQMFLAGLVDQRGIIQKDKIPERMVETDRGIAFVVVPKEESAFDRDIIFSEADIQNLLRSKAAMYSILTVAASYFGISFDDIAQFYVAGNFGSHINPQSAITIGMLPQMPADRFVDLGNASGAGAILILLFNEARAALDEIMEKIFYLEMNVESNFMNELTAALFLPHTNETLFPNVMKDIRKRQKL
jgi:uncharacterized 2Fe-2S/4Fe-4S cluster protein (DUF4445 family)